jgi:hypothetical protein
MTSAIATLVEASESVENNGFAISRVSKTKIQ